MNVSVTNMGDNGWGTIYIEVYQGTGNYTNCGTGYSNNLKQTIYLPKNETTKLTFTFIGGENHNNSGCYGVIYGVE